MTDVKAERIYSLDCTRAICMLWIVALWHMESYLDITIKCYITDDICSGVLAAFTFISGYFLGKKPVGNVKELLTFYKKRILRFYPLFFVSCMIFYLFLKNNFYYFVYFSSIFPISCGIMTMCGHKILCFVANVC